MTFDRRAFLNVGGVLAGVGAVALGGVTQAQAAPAPIIGGRSVAEFGVAPNSAADQTAALQKAIDEISASGHPVFIPGGRYTTATLKLPKMCTVTGAAGSTSLYSPEQQTIFAGDRINSITLSGLTFEGGTKRPDKPMVSLSGPGDATGGLIDIQYCRFGQGTGTALKLDGCSGVVHGVFIDFAYGAGILATNALSLTISQCFVKGGASDGIKASARPDAGTGVTITGNQVADCKGAGVAVAGNAVVSANHVARSRVGLRLGGGGDGYILASGNLMRECAIGIGVTASGETIFASLNLINAPKEGGIRAFDGDKLVGPDLVRQSAESYLNLTLGGNVVR